MESDLGQPSSYLALERGTPVYSCDGAEVGRVERVAEAPSEDIFDGFVLATGVLGVERYVKAEQVEEIFEHGVLLKIAAAAAGSLPTPGEGETPTV